MSERILQGLGVRYFETKEEAEKHLEALIQRDAKHKKWEVYEYELPDGRTVYGSTGGAAVLGWQIAVDFGFIASKANGGGRKQKSAEEMLAEMSDEQRAALLAKYGFTSVVEESKGRGRGRGKQSPAEAPSTPSENSAN